MMDSIAENTSPPDGKKDLDQTLAQRGSHYGNWGKQGTIAAQLKRVVRSVLDKDSTAPTRRTLMSAEQESIDMILHKISRLVCGDPAAQDDTWRDIAGYAEIARKLRESDNGGS